MENKSETDIETGAEMETGTEPEREIKMEIRKRDRKEIWRLKGRR